MGTVEGGEEVVRGHEERIYVSVRLRPLNAKEILKHDVSDWECINDNAIVYKNANLSASERSMYPSAYTFDKVFRPNCSTREVYEKAAKNVAISVVGGMNSSVFAYGQTSSGKTFTMTGITEYAIGDIYEYIQKHSEREFVLKFSALEIYNESVRDLLSVDSTPLRLLDDPERGTVVEKLTEETIRDWDHVIQLLSVCEAERQIGETSLNEVSSRSHQIIRLTVESSSLGRDNASALAAAVNFVDLAGSERASQALSAGTRLKEGCHINRSLLTLGTVIRKLSKGRGGHIPYRDSKLTRILQTSLGGNARTAIICTMSPARIHVEQSRNTLLFASCAKEVSTNARVNVVMSDKALVKYLQRELARLESELRSPQSTVSSSNHSAIVREKDLQIAKLEEKVTDLTVQRDVAQSQVKDLLEMIGDDASLTRVGLGHYPHMRVLISPDRITEDETSILADPHSSYIEARSAGHSRTSSEGQIVKVPYFDGNFVHSDASPGNLGSNFSDSYSDHGWEEIEKQSNGTSEDLCREVRCIETSSKVASDCNSVCSEENSSAFPKVKVYESPASPFENVGVFRASNDCAMEEDAEAESPKEEEKEEREVSFMQSVDFPCISTHELDKDSSIARFFMTRSRSCRARISSSTSPWFKMLEFSENTSSIGSERGFMDSEKKPSPYNFTPFTRDSSRKGSHFSPENTFDIEVDAQDEKLPSEMKEKTQHPTEAMRFKSQRDETAVPEADESPKRDVKDVGLDPIPDDSKSISSWPAEFQRLQREILELWHACNVSLIHRSYFFMLFQGGDPSDAIYMEVEVRRMKFLKDKFSRGENTIVNGRCLTLSLSLKAIREERRMLSKRMSKKLSEQERESLFVKWGIGLDTKLRRLQLAYRVWTKTEDMNHIADSAYLVAKLVTSMEQGQTQHKEMFGLNFTPRPSTRIPSFRRSLISFL